MKKKIVKKTVEGQVDDVAMGEGNTHSIEVKTSTEDYEVGTVQGKFTYYDEEAMIDPAVVEAGLTGLAESMVNDFTTKAIAEYNKASIQQGYVGSSGITFDTVVDAIAQLNLENESDLYMLISPGSVASFRKNLKDDLKYSEGFVRTGYIGSVCGVPVYISKAIDNGVAYIAKKDAITNFVKKGSEIEQDRTANTRMTDVYARKVNVIALTDERHLVKVGKTQATAASISTYTKNTKTVAGAATTSATVNVYINGTFDGSATAVSSAYSYTAKENLAAGDALKVVATLAGHVDSISTATVAE